MLVIGAGPYGVAVAQALWHRGRERGAEPLVVGEPFATWHEHTLDVMSLRSDPRGSSIFSPDGRYDFPAFLERHAGELEDDDVVPVSLYRRYLEDVERSLPFPLIRGQVERLESVERTEGRDAVFVARGRDASGRPFRVEAPWVVVATGLGRHRHLPAALRHLPRERVLHSWDAQAIEDVADARVLVIGGGQSAAESVLALAPGERNRVTWALKRPPLFFREPLRVPTPLFQLMLAGSRLLFMLPPPILRAVGRAAFRTTITPSLKPVWESESVERKITDAAGLGLEPVAGEGDGDDVLGIRDADGDVYDVVVSATGYRHTLAGLPFLSDELVERLGGADAAPELDGDFACAVPGLYFAGGIAEPTHGPAMRFVLGSRHAARRLGRVLGPAMDRNVRCNPPALKY